MAGKKSRAQTRERLDHVFAPPKLDGTNELYVESIDTDRFGNVFTTIKGLLVFEKGEFDALKTVADLRKKIQEELGDEFDYPFLFLNGQSVLTPLQERKATPKTVIQSEKKTSSDEHVVTEYKVSVRRVMTEGTGVGGGSSGSGGGGQSTVAGVGGDVARDDLDSAADDGGSVKEYWPPPHPPRSVGGASSSRGVKIKDKTVMLKLDIFAGVFERFYMTYDSDSLLSAYGPIASKELEHEYKRNLVRFKPSDTIQLNEVIRLAKYSGSITPPAKHFCLELYTKSGTKWVLALPSLALFSTWVKRVHKASPEMGGMKYTLLGDFDFAVSAKDSSDAKSRKSGSSSASNFSALDMHLFAGNVNRQVLHRGEAAAGGNEISIKSFFDVTFKTKEFGMKLASKRNGDSVMCTMVHSVLDDGIAHAKGVRSKDLILNVNKKSMMGVPWRRVKEEISKMPAPITITFGRPSRSRPNNAGNNMSSNLSSSMSITGLNVRKRLGPYVYNQRARFGRALGQLKQKATSKSAAAAAARTPSGERPESLMVRARASGGPAARWDAKAKFRALFASSPEPGAGGIGGGGMSSSSSRFTTRLGAPSMMEVTEESDFELDYLQERGAASLQLSRYRSVQSQLYQAIEESFKRDQKVDLALKRIMSNAKREQSIEPALLPHDAAVVVRDGLLSDSSEKPQKRQGDFPRTKSIRAAIAMSSRVSATQVTEARAVRLQKVEQAANFVRGKASLCTSLTLALFPCVKREPRLGDLIKLARTGDVDDQEDALDAILDIASDGSKSLTDLVEAGILPVLVRALAGDSIALRENAAGILWNLSDNAEIAQQIVEAGAIPPLLDLLDNDSNDEDSSNIAKEEAAGALWNLADDPGCKEDILKRRGAMEVLVRAISSRSGEFTEFAQENAAGALWNLASHPDCLAAIMRVGKGGDDVITALADMIQTGTVVAQENAAGTLMAISYSPAYRDRIKRARGGRGKKKDYGDGAVPLLVQLLAFGSTQGRENAAHALHHIALDDDETQRWIANEGAVPPLIRLLEPKYPVSTRIRAALCLRTLAQNKANKKEITQVQGSVTALVQALREEDALLQLHITEALWGLAHENESNKVFIAKAGAIPRLVHLLRNGNALTRSRAAGALGALAKDNQKNTNSIIVSGALKPLVAMVKQDSKESRIPQLEAAATLGRLSESNHKTQSKVLKSLQGVFKDSKEEPTDLGRVKARLTMLEEKLAHEQEERNDQDGRAYL